MPSPRPFSVFAGTSGNDDGYDATGAHGSQTDYYITPPSGSVWHISRLIVAVYDTKGLEPEKYTAAGALAQPINIYLSKYNDVGTLEETLLTKEGITQLHQWGHYCHDVTLQDWTNTTNEAVTVRWTFAKAGAPYVLKPGEKLIVRFTAGSNCSALLAHHFAFQGVDLSKLD
jgi:hypothetical protein